MQKNEYHQIAFIDEDDVLHPSMPVHLDTTRVKTCSHCKAPSYGIADDTTQKEINLGISAFEKTMDLENQRKRKFGRLFVSVYVCSECRHVDFYSDIIPKDLPQTEIPP